MWVSVSETAPSLLNILRTARLVPMEWPDSTLMSEAVRPSRCTSSSEAESLTKAR